MSGPVPNKIDAWLDNELSDEGFAEFEDWLKADQNNIETFVRAGLLHRRLRDVLRAQAVALESEAEPPLIKLSPLPSLSTNHYPLTTSHYPLTSNFVGGPVFSYMVATVVLCMMLLGGWFYKVSQVAELPGNFVEAPQNRRQYAFDTVGQITGMKDCIWAKDGMGAILGASVPMGRKYSLESGLLQLTYKSGANVILEGPCEYVADSVAGGYLRVGKLVARVEKQVASGKWPVARKEGREERGQGTGNRKKSSNGLAASAASSKLQAANPAPRIPNPESRIPSPRPLATSPQPLFSVRTPTAVVTDLGTEFGVEVNENGTTKADVFQGMVLFQAIERIHGTEQSVMLHAGQAARCAKGEQLTVSSSSSTEAGYVRGIAALKHRGKEVPASYDAIVLEVGDRDCDCRAVGINDGGQIVGFVQDISGKQYAFINDGDGSKARMLPGPNGEQSSAQCVNSDGVVAGHFIAGDSGNKIACIWDSEGKCVRLDVSGKYVSSEAWGINAAGATSGFGTFADGNAHSFVYTASGEFADIGGLGGSISKATEINDAGQVVGYSTLHGVEDDRAYLFSDGIMAAFDAADGISSRAFAINNRGTAAGFYSTISGIRGARAFILNTDSKQPKMARIASLGTFSIAFDINDSEQVVGRYWNGIDTIENYRAFVFANGRMHDLNDLTDLPAGCVLRQARSINNTGQIAAWGTDGSGRQFACLLTPAATENLSVEKGGNLLP